MSGEEARTVVSVLAATAPVRFSVTRSRCPTASRTAAIVAPSGETSGSRSRAPRVVRTTSAGCSIESIEIRKQGHISFVFKLIEVNRRLAQSGRESEIASSQSPRRSVRRRGVRDWETRWVSASNKRFRQIAAVEPGTAGNEAVMGQLGYAGIECGWLDRGR